MNTSIRVLWIAVTIGSAAASQAATFTVANTNDAGTGSFRQAIVDANSTPGANMIQFNLPGVGVRTIAPLSALPDITNSLTINGYSQPGSSANTLANSNNAVLLVRLDGVSLPSGFAPGLRFFGANNNTLRGLIIVRFYTGVQLYNSSGTTIAGNWLGLDADGVNRGGSGTGIEVTCDVFRRSTANFIGGTNPADRNVIGGFGEGVSFSPGSADHNTVQGNFIGTDPTGSLPRHNGFEGIRVQTATNIVIGGVSAGARNVISANGTGILLLGSSGDLVQGNLIGTDVSGHYALGNSGDGIVVQGSASTTIGSGAGNLIGNNSGYGINLLGSTNTTVQGNWIGTDAGGVWPMGNGKDGIYVQGGGSANIGGTSAGAGNVIRYNNGAGINVSSGVRNAILGNSIFDNAGLGIDLGADGVTANDACDSDSGANQLQNFPELTGAGMAFGMTQVQGTLNSQPSTLYRLEFFASAPWDATGMPEGQIYLGATNVTTDASCTATFSTSLPVLAASNMVVTATATDPLGNTSEFSVGAPLVTGLLGVSLSVSGNGSTQTVSWPLAASTFQLEATTSLNPPVQWHTINGGITDNGTMKIYVTTNTPPTNQFFRLRE